MAAALYATLEQTVKVLDSHRDLPEYLSVSVNSEGVWVTPYIHGAPMTALLAWADAMSEREVIAKLYSGDFTTVEVNGLLDSLPVHATGSTYAFIHLMSDGRVAIDDLRRVAAEEEAFK